MSPTDLPVNRKCSIDGCESVIQASNNFLAALAQDNEYVICPKGHEQPLFAFASVEQERDWLFRRYKALRKDVCEAWQRRASDLRCPFHRRGVVLRDAMEVVRHVVKRHRVAVERLIVDLNA